MKPIHKRTEWHEYTTLERCKKTGRPIQVYSAAQQNKMIWDSMTREERLKLFKVNQLVSIGWLGLTPEEQQEFRELSDWMEYHEISLDDLPPEYRGEK